MSDNLTLSFSFSFSSLNKGFREELCGNEEKEGEEGVEMMDAKKVVSAKMQRQTAEGKWECFRECVAYLSLYASSSLPSFTYLPD